MKSPSVSVANSHTFRELIPPSGSRGAKKQEKNEELRQKISERRGK